MSARWHGILTGLGLVAVAAAIVLFPAALMRSKGHHGASTASAAVASPPSLVEGIRLWFGVGKLPDRSERHAAEDRLAYTLISLAYTCQKVGLTEQQCDAEYDEAMRRAR